MSRQTTTISTPIAALAPRRADTSAANVSTIVNTWMARRAERRALRELAESGNEHMLNDIGVTREQAQHTAAKWFWQP